MSSRPDSIRLRELLIGARPQGQLGLGQAATETLPLDDSTEFIHVEYDVEQMVRASLSAAGAQSRRPTPPNPTRTREPIGRSR